MKRQHLVALAILVVLLVGIRVLVSRRSSGSAANLSEAGVHRVLPKEIDPKAVTWVQISAPAPAAASAPADASAPEAPAAPPPLRYEKRDGAWVVLPGGAPADAAALDAFVEKAATLAGETRGSGESQWATFGVAPKDAVKIELGTEAGAAAGTLWVGKQGDDSDAHFVRADGADAVLHVQDGLRAPLGLFGSAPAPVADLWLSKDVIAVKAADATAVAFERADMRVVLEKREAPAPPSAPEGASAPAPAPAEASWAISEPVLAWPARTGLDGVVDRAGQVRVNAALDAESAACTAEPVASVTFTLAGGATKVVRVRGQVEGKDEAALTIDGMPHCWSLSTWSLGTLLPRASALWEAPSLFPAKDDAGAAEPTRLRVDRGGRVATATKSGTDWKVSGEGLDASRASSIASAVRFLRVEDIAREPSPPSPPFATVSADVAGKTLTVRLLGERLGGFGDRYARAEGAAIPAGYVLVVGKSTVQSLLP